MRERMVSFVCPYCHHEFQMKRDTLAISGITSKIDERLYDGTYFGHVCQNCHHLFQLEYAFLYRNVDKHFVLTMHAKLNPFEKNELVVVCKDVPQFLLAYRILIQSLNISFVLKKKKMLELKKNEKVDFDFYDEKNQCLWFKLKNNVLAVPITVEEREKEVYNKSKL